MCEPRHLATGRGDTIQGARTSVALALDQPQKTRPGSSGRTETAPGMGDVMVCEFASPRRASRRDASTPDDAHALG